MGIDPEDYRRMVARLTPMPTPGNTSSGVTKESDLHGDIFDECRRRGWIALHGAIGMATHRTDGEPDFVIIAENRVLFVECKTKTGKVTTPQLAMIAHAKKLGHTIHVVRSLEEFLNVIRSGQ